MREASSELGSKLSRGRGVGESKAMPSVLAWVTDRMRKHLLRGNTREGAGEAGPWRVFSSILDRMSLKCLWNIKWGHSGTI